MDERAERQHLTLHEIPLDAVGNDVRSGIQFIQDLVGIRDRIIARLPHLFDQGVHLVVVPFVILDGGENGAGLGRIRAVGQLIDEPGPHLAVFPFTAHTDVHPAERILETAPGGEQRDVRDLRGRSGFQPFIAGLQACQGDGQIRQYLYRLTHNTIRMKHLH